jgi:5-methylcytosine-specific restriction protein A
MTRTLLRNCVGCGRSVRGKPRCTDCERDYQRAKRAKRPDLYSDAAERRRRAMAVSDWRAMMGDFCPGWAGQPAHPSADLTADHVKEVRRGGDPGGKLVVRCRSCNAARSAHLAHRALAKLAGQSVPTRVDTDSASPISAGQTTRRQPNSQLHSASPRGDMEDGPAVA